MGANIINMNGFRTKPTDIRTLITTRTSRISLSSAKPSSTKYSLLWSSWKSKLPSYQYFEYISDKRQCFCLYTIVACYTLRNFSHSQSLDDTLLYSSVLSFCTICGPNLSPVCASDDCLEKLQDCLSWRLELIELYWTWLNWITRWYHVLFLPKKKTTAKRLVQR